MSTAGPAAWTPAPDPRNRPAPIALPRPIMVSWREVMLGCSPVAGRTAVDFIVMLAYLLGVEGSLVLVGPIEFTVPAVAGVPSGPPPCDAQHLVLAKTSRTISSSQPDYN